VEYEKKKVEKEDGDVIAEEIDFVDSPNKEDMKDSTIVQAPVALAQIILTNKVENTEEYFLLKELMGFLVKDNLNSTLCGYWSSVALHLVERNLDKMIEFFDANSKFLALATNRIDSISISEFIQKILLDDGNDVEGAMKKRFSLMKNNIISDLIEKLGEYNEKSTNSAQVLLACIESKGPMLELITQTQFLKKLMDVALKLTCSYNALDVAGRNSLKSCISVIKCILEAKCNKAHDGGMLMELRSAECNINIDYLLAQTEFFAKVIEVVKCEINRFEGNKNENDRKVVMIKLIELINALLLTNNQMIFALLIDTNIHSSLIQFIVRNPGCSIMICNILEGINYIAKNYTSTTAPLIEHIFLNDCLINFISRVENDNKAMSVHQYELLKVMDECLKPINNKISDKWSTLPESAIQKYTSLKATCKLDIGTGLYKQSIKVEQPCNNIISFITI
jgi:hypothetical protein